MKNEQSTKLLPVPSVNNCNYKDHLELNTKNGHQKYSVFLYSYICVTDLCLKYNMDFFVAHICFFAISVTKMKEIQSQEF